MALIQVSLKTENPPKSMTSEDFPVYSWL